MAAKSDAGMTDEVQVVVNGEPRDPASLSRDEQVPADDTSQTLPSVGDRPADGAAKARWVDYAERLGLDRGVAEGWTKTRIVAWVDGTPSDVEG